MKVRAKQTVNVLTAGGVVAMERGAEYEIDDDSAEMHARAGYVEIVAAPKAAAGKEAAREK